MDELLAEITALEVAANDAKHAAKGHTDIQRNHERRVEELRAQIKALMIEAGCVTDQSDRATVSIVQTPPKLVIDDPGAIPDEFYDTEPVRADARIKARLVSGVAVPGARLVSGETVKINWRTNK
jgi:Na+/H+ antiporter NhaB